MIAKVQWQGSWAPPQMKPADLAEFAQVVRLKGIKWTRKKLLPFPWHLLVANLGIAAVAMLLAWPIGNYGDENHVSVATGAAAALGLLAVCLILSSVLVLLQHAANLLRVWSWLRSLTKAAATHP